MATQRGTQMALLYGGSVPAPGFMDGAVHVFNETVALAGQPTTDIVEIARLPKGAVPLYGIIESDTSLGTSTVAIGTAVNAGKYRAAATFTATDMPTLFGAGAGIGAALLDEETVILTIGTAALPASGTLRVMFFYSFD